MILGNVSAVTHSVGNCLKRVVVIVSSVIFFQTQLSPLNSFGKCSHPSSPVPCNVLKSETEYEVDLQELH